MIISHATAIKVLIVYSAIALSAIAVNPTIEVALIVAVPGMITGIGTLTLAFLARNDAKQIRTSQSNMQASIDGHFTKLLEQRSSLGEQLVDKTDKLAHAEGVKEGSDSERAIQKEDRKSD